MGQKIIITCMMLLVAILYGQVKLIGDNEIMLAPQVLNYQGYLTDDQDIPITNPSISMTFSIWTAQGGGSQLWTETQSVSVDKGVFSVILGTVTPVPFSVFTGGTSRWLQLVVAGQTMSPRTRITASPYAYTSTYADTAVYAQNVDMPGLDDRYVNVIGPDSIYANSGGTLFRVKQLGTGVGIYATRPAGAITNPTVYIENSGSGAGLLARAYNNDVASPGILGRHDNGRPAIYGTYGSAFVGAPAINAGISGYSASGPALHARAASQYGLDIDSTTAHAINIDYAGNDGLYVDYCPNQGVQIDSSGQTAFYARKAGYNGFGVDYSNYDGYVVLYPTRDAFSLWQTAGRHGLYMNRTNYNGINIQTADSHGVYINSAGKRGITINSVADDGYAITYAADDGVYIDSANGGGVDIDYAGYGVDILTVNNSGVYVFATNTPSSSAMYINNAAGNGYRVFDAGYNGFEASNTGRHGLYVNSADSHGVSIRDAGLDGLYVRKAASNGIQIDTATSYGINIGQASYGVYVDSATGDGFWAYHPADDGFYVSSCGGDAFYCSSAGNRGMYIGATGSYGIYVSNPATYGIYANSNNERGGYFRNNNNSYYALTAWNNTGTGGTIRGLYIQGHGYATGGWQTFLGDGKTGFAITSPDMEIVISGSGSLVNGQTVISFDNSYNNVFSKNIELKVIVTPTSECNGVFIKNKTSNGFEVKELINGRSNATFDWIAIARVKGYEQTLYTEPLQAVPHAETEAPQLRIQEPYILTEPEEPKPEIIPAQNKETITTRIQVSDDEKFKTSGTR